MNLKSPKTFISKSERETKRLANELLKNINIGKKPIIFALQGELGTGKTQFTKGLAKSLGIKQNIRSPTFFLVREYNIKEKNLKFLHLDTYSMFEQEEFVDLGFENMIKQPNIIVIEWAEKVSKILREIKDSVELIWIKFEYQGKNTRKIKYSNEIL